MARSTAAACRCRIRTASVCGAADRVAETLAGIWAQVLKVERVGLSDNFMSLAETDPQFAGGGQGPQPQSLGLRLKLR